MTPDEAYSSLKGIVKSFVESGYKVNDIFTMKLADIMLLTEMMDTDASDESGLTEDFLSLLM